MKNKNKMTKKVTDIVFLLDRSGSMQPMVNDTIGGYNSYLEKMKDENANVTTVLFDDRYEMITERKFIKKVKKLNNKTYYTRGSTALLDAIGKTIKYMDNCKPNKVLFVITTDGYENTSVEYNKGQIKELIEGHSNWEFIYIGSDIDSYGEASSIGIKRNRISNCEKSSNGYSLMFDCIGSVSKKYCKESYVENNWNDEIESYINKNKKM